MGSTTCARIERFVGKPLSSRRNLDKKTLPSDKSKHFVNTFTFQDLYLFFHLSKFHLSNYKFFSQKETNACARMHTCAHMHVRTVRSHTLLAHCAFAQTRMHTYSVRTHYYAQSLQSRARKKKRSLVEDTEG